MEKCVMKKILILTVWATSLALSGCDNFNKAGSKPAADPVAAAPAAAPAQPPNRIADHAAKVKPVYKTVSRRECHPQQVTVQVDVPNPVKPVEHNNIGMVLGALGGAILGHQVGNGSGNTVATLAGAAGGAYVGDKIANRNNQPSQPGTHKETRTTTTEVCNDVVERVRVR
jgi:uncharacterized protein YcfJ